MTKSRKIVEARAIITRDLGGLRSRLSKLLTPKEMKALDSSMGFVDTAKRILEVDIMRLDPTILNKIGKYGNLK